MASRAALAIVPMLAPSVMAHILTVNCAPLTIQRGDPIVFPGVLSPHVHSVVGGTAFALTQSNEDAKAANATTCDKLLDNSNYWQPQLYHQRTDARFEMVDMQGIVSLGLALNPFKSSMLLLTICRSISSNMMTCRPPTTLIGLATTSRVAKIAKTHLMPRPLPRVYAWLWETRPSGQLPVLTLGP